jgi:hypothetical protein
MRLAMQRILIAILLLLSTSFVHAQFTAGAVYIGSNPENFGTVAVGSSNTLSRSIQITSSSTVPVQIAVSTTGAGYSISGGTCLPGATLPTPNGNCTLNLTFTPPAVGSFLGTLAINCLPFLASGGITVNCSQPAAKGAKTPSAVLATTSIALQGVAISAASLPVNGRVALSLLALLIFAIALWSMRRRSI